MWYASAVRVQLRQLALPLFAALAACSSGSFEVASATDASSEDTASGGDSVADSPPLDSGAVDGAAIDAGGTGDTGGATDATGEGGPIGCDPADTPGDVGVLYVAAGVGAGGDGTRLHPFSKITAAMAAATAATSKIALAPGRYAEAVTFTADGAFLEGGWLVTGTAWTRDCQADARAKTVLASPTPIGLAVGALTKRSGLRVLTVTTKAACGVDASGIAESCIGIYLRNGTAGFVLRDVDVVAGPGGRGRTGADGVAGVNGLPPGSCKCASGDSGSDGKAGPNGNPGGYGTDRGFTPGDGQDGARGGDGSPGTAGGAGVSGSCTTACTGDMQCNPANAYCGDSVGTVSAAPGSCGCPATAGQPGKAGGGGGGSIGILATGDATLKLELNTSSVKASAGGDGGPGGAAGKGAQGSDGKGGAGANCPSGCARLGAPACGCATKNVSMLAGGSAGGSGGAAGASGAGGGGAGGVSIALVHVGLANVLLDPASTAALSFATGGKGGGSAPNGFSGAQFP